MRISNNSNFENATVNSKSVGKKTQTKDVFKDELGQFESKVKDRIENGAPAYSLGMTSMTEQDWEELMDNIDDYMEKAKELQMQKKEQLKEESIESRIYNKFFLQLNSKNDE